MRCDGCARFAAENIVETRERAALVIEPVVIEEWIADAPTRETIDDDVEFVLGRTFGRRTVPGEDAFVETLHLVDDRQFHL